MQTVLAARLGDLFGELAAHSTMEPPPEDSDRRKRWSLLVVGSETNDIYLS